MGRLKGSHHLVFELESRTLGVGVSVGLNRAAIRNLRHCQRCRMWSISQSQSTEAKWSDLSHHSHQRPNKRRGTII